MALTASQITSARLYLADRGTSSVQSVLLQNATGGTFTLSYGGQTTSALAYNAGANVVQNALAALSTIGVGNVLVEGTAPYAVMFQGTLANLALPMLTLSSSLTGPGTTTAVSSVIPGGVYAFADADLNSLYSDAVSNFWLAIAYGYRVLQADSAKFNDYVIGQSQEKKSQIFKQLSALEALYIQWSQSDKQVRLASMMSVPPRTRAIPWQGGGDPDSSLVYQTGNKTWPWRRRGW